MAFFHTYVNNGIDVSTSPTTVAVLNSARVQRVQSIYIQLTAGPTGAVDFNLYVRDTRVAGLPSALVQFYRSLNVASTEPEFPIQSAFPLLVGPHFDLYFSITGGVALNTVNIAAYYWETFENSQVVL